MHCTRGATVLSIVGIGAFDLVSRQAVLEGLHRVEGGDSAFPFVFGSPSSNFWEDDHGQVHTLTQAEGGEQRDRLMPALFSLAQHPAFEGIQRRLCAVVGLIGRHSSRVPRDWVSSIFAMLQEELFQHSATRVHHGKTKLWNQPSGTAASTAAARISDPDAIVWCGDQALPTSEQGIRILGTPVGTPGLRAR